MSETTTVACNAVTRNAVRTYFFVRNKKILGMYVQRCTHTALHGGGCNVCTLKDHVPTIPYSRSARVPKDRVTTYTVQYASGKRFRLTGRLGRVQIPGSRLMSPSIDPGAPQAMIVLDPHAVIRDPLA